MLRPAFCQIRKHGIHLIWLQVVCVDITQARATATPGASQNDFAPQVTMQVSGVVSLCGFPAKGKGFIHVWIICLIFGDG